MSEIPAPQPPTPPVPQPPPSGYADGAPPEDNVLIQVRGPDGELKHEREAGGNG